MNDRGAIDEQVRELVEAHRDQLAELVDQAVGRALAELVAERLARGNGNGLSATADPEEPDSAPSAASESVAVKLCTTCGKREPPQYRRVCDHCRNAARARAKREAAAELLEEPRPARKQNRGGKLLGNLEQAHQAARRVVIAQAPVETVVDGDGREWTLRRLPPSPTATSQPQAIALRHMRAISEHG